MTRTFGLLCATVLTAAACKEPPFEHANVWDPRYELQGEILPRVDSVLSRGATIQLRLELAETPPAVPVAWTVTCIPETGAGPCPTASITDQGLLQVDPTPFPRRLRVVASLGSQRFELELTAVQRAVSWRFRCLPEEDSTCNVGASFNQPLGRMVNYFDAGGFGIAPQPALPDTLEAWAVYSWSDPGVITRVRGYLHTGFRNGSTLIVREQFGIVDTLAFRVAQVAASARFVCGEFTIGDTVTLAFSEVRDSLGFEVQRPLLQDWSASSESPDGWSYDPVSRRLTATSDVRVRTSGTLRDSVSGTPMLFEACDIVFLF